MNNLRVLDPAFSDPFDNLMSRFFSPAVFDGSDANTSRGLTKMRLDVSEKPDAYQVKADIPGVKKEDISVHIEGNMVQIEAETRRERDLKDGTGDKVLRCERQWGTVSRSFSLAHDVDESKVQASYADGVLSLTLPKKAAAASKKITVQ